MDHWINFLQNTIWIWFEIKTERFCVFMSYMYSQTTASSGGETILVRGCFASGHWVTLMVHKTEKNCTDSVGKWLTHISTTITHPLRHVCESSSLIHRLRDHLLRTITSDEDPTLLRIMRRKSFLPASRISVELIRQTGRRVLVRKLQRCLIAGWYHSKHSRPMPETDCWPSPPPLHVKTLKGPIPYIYGTQVRLSLCLQMS